MTLIATSPAYVDQATEEIRTWGCDVTKNLDPSAVPPQTVTDAATTLINLSTGGTVTLADSPTVNGNVIKQRVEGSALTAGVSYRLIWTFTPSNTSDVIANALQINCPF